MTPKNILLIRLSSIGDVLHCTPVARTLREQFPKAKISWLVGETSQDILHGNPYLDEIIVWQREKWEREVRKGSLLKGYQNFRLLEKILREGEFDVAIDMHGLLLTGLIAWRSGAQMRIGFAKAKEGSPLFYTHRVQSNSPLPIVEHYLQLLQPLGVVKLLTETTMPIYQEHQDFAEQILDAHHIKKDDTIIALNPSTSWVTKCWPADYFVQLTDLLMKRLNVKVIILGAPSDMPLVDKITNNSSEKVINLAGKTNLKELAAVIQKTNLFIGGDTGPLHIAAAVGTPTISLFGPTNPRIYAPAGVDHVAIASKVSCRYCHSRRCKELICMEEIDPLDVYQAALQIIKRRIENKNNMEEVAYGPVPIKKIHFPV